QSARLLVCLSPCLVCSTGCQQQMAAQPSYKPLDPSTFFADGRSARPLLPGTVPRGHLRTDAQLFTGKRTAADISPDRSAALLAAAERGPLTALAIVAAQEESEVEDFPFPITRSVLERGRD